MQRPDSNIFNYDFNNKNKFRNNSDTVHYNLKIKKIHFKNGF